MQSQQEVSNRTDRIHAPNHVEYLFRFVNNRHNRGQVETHGLFLRIVFVALHWSDYKFKILSTEFLIYHFERRKILPIRVICKCYYIGLFFKYSVRHKNNNMVTVYN